MYLKINEEIEEIQASSAKDLEDSAQLPDSPAHITPSNRIETSSQKYAGIATRPKHSDSKRKLVNITSAHDSE